MGKRMAQGPLCGLHVKQIDPVGCDPLWTICTFVASDEHHVSTEGKEIDEWEGSSAERYFLQVVQDTK